MPVTAAAMIPALISGGGAVAGGLLGKTKKSKQQKMMEQLQFDLTQKAAQRNTQLQPVHDSILRAYAAMTSPSGSDVGAQTMKALPGGANADYYGNPTSPDWWGKPPNIPQPRY